MGVIRRIGRAIRKRLWSFSQSVKRFSHNLRFILTDLKFPLGHSYCPLFSKKEVIRNEKRIFKPLERNLKDVDLNETEQFQLLNHLKVYYEDLPFQDTQEGSSCRFFYNNSFFKHFDAVMLYSMLRHFRPERVVEIGSGFTSALILDVNEQFLDNKTSCTFIDPHPERLRELTNRQQAQNSTIISKPIQELGEEYIQTLKANDILLIDSSHVVKVGSDVHHILFHLLPALNSGVIIHFHDIFYPFEYPKEWILKGIPWNEAYVLRAFLSFNPQFKILMFNSFVENFYQNWFRDHMPLCLHNPGQSLWLKKVF